MALSQTQLDVASYLETTPNAPKWTRRDNAKTIVFTHHKGEQRYVIKPRVTQKQKRFSKELGGGWFNVRSIPNLKFLEAARNN